MFLVPRRGKIGTYSRADRGQAPGEIVTALGLPVSVHMVAKRSYACAHLRVVFLDGKVSKSQRFLNPVWSRYKTSR
jgi:hypothetical protein